MTQVQHRTAIDMLTTANHRSVTKSLILTSWESVANDVIIWEHCDINKPSDHM